MTSFSKSDSRPRKTKKVIVVYGTRPEAIKVAPIIKEMERSSSLSAVAVVTGQHREMLDQVNEVFEIKPSRDLDLFRHGQNLNQLASRIFLEIDPVYVDEDPDAVLVQGDTTTVLAAAIAAFYRKIPVIHLEAGLRSHDIHSPFPEEANRKMVGQIAALHLAPTETSKLNLLGEGINSSSIVVTGNSVIDSLVYSINKDPDGVNVPEEVDTSCKIILVTTHRRENWGDAMHEIARALREIAIKHSHVLVVVPMHRNPIVRKALTPQLEGLHNVVMLEPLPYESFASLLNASHIVVTDSGGIQEEAPTLGKPVLVLRMNTERPEAVEAGTVRLIGTQYRDIVNEVNELLTDDESYQKMSRAVNPYGDGSAAVRAVAAIEELLGVGKRMNDFSAE